MGAKKSRNRVAQVMVWEARSWEWGSQTDDVSFGVEGWTIITSMILVSSISETAYFATDHVRVQ